MDDYFLLEHIPHGGPIGYGEIPKATFGGTPAAAANNSAAAAAAAANAAIEHQLYATIQRKQPPVPPFNSSKGFDTMSKNNVLYNSANVTPVVRQQAELRCNTLGRIKNLEMTEYQKQKLIDEANTVKIRVGLYNLSLQHYLY